jgi:hypothetical protein
MKSLYTTRETMAECAIGLTKLYDEINDGKLVAVKDGRRTYVTGDSIAARNAALKRLETPTMKAKLGGQAQRGDPPPLEAEHLDRESPRSRFTSVAPRSTTVT